jgi:hypothetical protein
MCFYDPFGYLKHKLWPKEGSGIKLLIWLPTTKSQESPQLIYVQVACHIPLESSRWGLQLCFRPHLNQRFAKEVMGIQSCKSPNFGKFRDSQLGSLGTKWHLGVGPVTRQKKYYKGEGGGFPQIRVVMNLVSPCLPVASPCTKSVPITH